MDGDIAQFTAITGASAERAAQYLQISDGSLENAIQLYFESPDITFAGSTASQPAAPAGQQSGGQDAPITIDSDNDEDEGPEVTAPGGVTAARAQQGAAAETDEEMARRLQGELYGSEGGPAADIIRAPIARTTEQLVGPDATWGSEDGGVEAAVAHQLMARERERARARARTGRAGIFNQREVPSIWNEVGAGEPPEAMQQRRLAAATGGASEASSKSSMLAELFRPPFDLMYHGQWEGAREKGKDEEKWLLVNVQDPSIFDCQVLNRDIWKNEGVRETVRESFVFMQFNRDDPRGQEYVNYYFSTHELNEAYPHVAIVDPRTGEQVKVWSGRPVPQAIDFLSQLHEFLDRYSLKITAKNPVAKRKAEAKQVDVSRMTEDEMLEMAMANSLQANGAPGPVDDDPDTLTRSGILGKGKAPLADLDRGTATPDLPPDAPAPNGAPRSVYSRISDSKPHQEPPQDPSTTTRIQFRHPTGRVVRRFALADPVRRLYEWLKAEPLEGRQGQAFELVSMGKNLADSLDETVADAGLKMGTVMVEFVADDEA